MNYKYKWSIILLVLMMGFITSPVLAESQAGKVQIFGGEIYIPDEQRVNGDSVAIFADQEIYGEVTGSVVTIFGDLILKGTANEVVTIFGNVTLQDGAVVRTDLVNIMGRLKRLGDTKVLGEVNTMGVGDIHVNTRHMSGFRMPGLFFNRGTQHFGDLFLSILLTVILIHVFLPNLTHTYQAAVADPVRAGVRGLLGAVVLIIIAILMAITIIGIPVAMVVGLLAWAAFSFANVAMYLYIGKRVAEQMEWDVNPYVKGIIGSVIINVLAAFPLLGLIKLIVGWIGFGGVLETKFGTGQKWIR